MPYLKGLKILDFSSLLPGPFATLCLADLGAEVLWVKSASRPDMVDLLPPFIEELGMSAGNAYLGRGKKIIRLNLKKEKAVKIVYDLIRTYDIVVEQSRPGVMSRLGVGYEDLKGVNPALIYCSISGYGQDGPLKDRAGHDINYLALSGLMGYSGRKAYGPSLTGMQIADLAAGSQHAVIGILSAVIHRMQTGEGSYLDISMTDGLMAFHALTGASFLAGAREPAREEEVLNGGSLYDFYETKDGRYLSVGCLEQHFFQEFCERLGRPELASHGIWSLSVQRVKEELRAVFKQKTLREWMEIFAGSDACVEPVLSLSEALDSDLARFRGIVKNMRLPSGCELRQIASCFPEARKGELSLPKESTYEVLLALGYREEEIDSLTEEGVLI